MTSTIKVDNIQKVSDGSSIIKKCGSTITVGSCGATVALASGATQTGFGTPSSSVLWCTTAKTSPFTAADKVGYFINTTGGTITVTLPSSPSAGDVVAFKDYANTWDTNAVTLNNNGSKINGVCGNATLSTEDQSVTLVYVDGTKGWRAVQDSTSGVIGSQFISATGGTIVTNGDFKTHIFTGDATFCVSAGAGPVAVVDYFVVAGGAGGGGGPSPSGSQGGGGAGGFRMYSTAPGSNSPLNHPSNAIPVTAQGYPITVGGGGTAGTNSPPAPSNQGGPGANSVFGSITSAGGGGGGTSSIGNPAFPPTSDGSGVSGGSGGGTAYQNPGHAGFSGGLGNTPPVSPPQGNNGGTSGQPGAPFYAGGGGGGAGGAGVGGGPGGTGNNGGTAGVGSYIADPFIGPTAPSYGTPGPESSTRYFAGGGGGGGSTGATGGTGGGGTGGNKPGTGNAATANTGGGGGGGANSSGATGGSGFVAIRYKFQ